MRSVAPLTSLYITALLLLTRPINQLLPIPTLVFRSKPMNAIDLRIYHHHRGIGPAHEALADQINAMSNMTRLQAHRQISVRQQLALARRVVVGPVAMYWNQKLGLFLGGLTKQCSW